MDCVLVRAGGHSFQRASLVSKTKCMSSKHFRSSEIKAQFVMIYKLLLKIHMVYIVVDDLLRIRYAIIQLGL